MPIIFFNETQTSKEAGVSVTGFTKFTWNKITYRANPCYKQDRAWFDWVLVAWTIPAGTNHAVVQDPNYPNINDLPLNQNRDKREEKAILVPAKAIAFIEDNNNDPYALIHSCWHYQKNIGHYLPLAARVQNYQN